MENFKKWMIGGLITFAIITVGGGLLVAYLWEQKSMIIPAVVLLSGVILLGGHIILAVENKPIDVKEHKQLKNWAWVTGSLSLFCLVFLLWFFINPNTNNHLRVVLFPKSVCVCTEEVVGWQDQVAGNSEDSDNTTSEIDNGNNENSIDWFIKDCIPDRWAVFDLDARNVNGCWISYQNVIDGIDDGFTVTSTDLEDRNFILYTPIGDDISRITFSVQVSDLQRPIGDRSTEFFFGFVPEDLNEIYPTGSLSDDYVEYNGEFIIFCGLNNDSTYGYIYQGENTYTKYTRPQNAIDIKTNYVYFVEVDINEDSWTVRIHNISTGDVNGYFIGENLGLLGRYFAFGARIPENGSMNIRVFDFTVE